MKQKVDISKYDFYEVLEKLGEQVTWSGCSCTTSGARSYLNRATRGECQIQRHHLGGRIKYTIFFLCHIS